MRIFPSLALLLSCATAHADWQTFLFSADATNLAPRSAAVETGAGYNGLPLPHAALAEDARRIDTWLSAAAGVTRWLQIDGTVGFADTPDRQFGFGYGRVELKAELLRPRPRFPVAIAVGGGYQVDALLEHAVTALVATTLEQGRVRVSVNVRTAHYFHEGRDPIDVMLTAGASLRVRNWLRLGAEYVGEELEGAVDGGEVEVGAGGRHYLGPSAQVALAGGRLRIGATLGPVFTRAQTSALGRASLSYLF